MKNFGLILWDIDGTLLNFHAAQSAAIRRCFEFFRLGGCTDEMLADYDRINEKHWQALERGELTKPQVLEGRFREFFTKYGIPTAAIPDFNEEYQLRLGDTIVFFPNAMEALEACKAAGIRQFAVTNGTKLAQVRRLAVSGLDKLFDGVFISDEIGYEKPDPRFFAPVFAPASSRTMRSPTSWRRRPSWGRPCENPVFGKKFPPAQILLKKIEKEIYIYAKDC